MELRSLNPSLQVGQKLCVTVGSEWFRHGPGFPSIVAYPSTVQWGLACPLTGFDAHDDFPLHELVPESGYPDMGEGGEALRSQPNFIQKPFTQDELVRRVREVLDSNTPRE
jgi:hypothetical protein